MSVRERKQRERPARAGRRPCPLLPRLRRTQGVDPGLFTEVFWASLHGPATLTREGRLPPEDTEQRVELLVGLATA